MALVNEHFLKLASNYLFADIAKKVKAYKIAHPKQQVISLGIGDVTQPLCPAVIKAMHKAVDEMAVQASFRGYGPERGYDFLREAIIKNDFLPRGIHLDPNEVFVNDGAKSDTGNIQEILRWDNNIGVTDPIYPVYIDSNVMIGRAGVFENGKWSNVTYMPCNDGNDFTPQIPDHRVDMIYLCYPNNPTGTVITKEELRKWVNYAIKNESIILYDAAYEAYITDPEIPHSIYEIRGARKVAIEFHSYSKTAGFTGVRCGYTIWRGSGIESYLGPSPMYQVQWYQLHLTTSCRSYLHPRGQRAGKGYHQLLYGECSLYERKTSGTRIESLWWRKCTLSLGKDS